MSNAPKPGSYIDTQGMGAPMSAADAKKARSQVYKPATVRPRRYTNITLPTKCIVYISVVAVEL